MAYVVVSMVLRARQRALGIAPSKELRFAIRVGVLWVNGPLLPVFLAPLAIQKWLWPGSASVVIQGGLLLLGFVLAWAWWSVNVSLWRRWATRRGLEAESLQLEGESPSLLWPKGHFFERTEYDHLRKRGGP